MSDASLHRRDLAALVACAQARVRFPDLAFADPMAEEILGRLDVPKRTYDERELRGLTLLSATVDALARDFFERHPEGIGVALCPGLCCARGVCPVSGRRHFSASVPSHLERKVAPSSHPNTTASLRLRTAPAPAARP